MNTFLKNLEVIPNIFSLLPAFQIPNYMSLIHLKGQVFYSESEQVNSRVKHLGDSRAQLQEKF